MSNQHNTRAGIAPWTATETIAQHSLVCVATGGDLLARKTSGVADYPMGIAAEAASSGDTFGVIPFDRSQELRVIVGGAVAPGDLLQVDSGLDGGMIEAASGVIGRAIACETGASGQRILVIPAYGTGA